MSLTRNFSKQFYRSFMFPNTISPSGIKAFIKVDFAQKPPYFKDETAGINNREKILFFL